MVKNILDGWRSKIMTENNKLEDKLKEIEEIIGELKLIVSENEEDKVSKIESLKDKISDLENSNKELLGKIKSVEQNLQGKIEKDEFGIPQYQLMKNQIEMIKYAIDYILTYDKVENMRFGNKKSPKIICLCGSTRFSKEYQEANLRFTLEGHIVLTIGADMKSDNDLFSGKSPEELEEIKKNLDELHKRKIDLADEIFVINPGGYVGNSTNGEIEYARRHGKKIKWLIYQ